MTIQLFSNNAKTTLASAISSSQTSITVATGKGSLFPSPSTGQQFKVTLVSATDATVFEICNCTSRTGDVLTVIRGQEGTSGQPFLLNDIVGHYDTAGVMSSLVQADQLQNGAYVYADVGGTANALTAAIASNLTTLPDGLNLVLGSAYANTGPVTLTLTLGSTVQTAHPIVKGNNIALAANDIPSAGYPIQINWSPEFNAYVMQNPATGILISVTPTGAIMQFPCTTAPSGFLVTNGQLVSRTTYANLWAFAQASGNIISDTTWLAGQYGSFSIGDGSTTFRLPQYGGYFLRTLDNGNGIDSGRAIGTVQNYSNFAHTHTASSTSSVSDPGHTHVLSPSVQGLVFNGGPSGWKGEPTGSTYTYSPSATNSNVTLITVATSTSINSSGGSESRPINISVLTCIKY